MQLSGSLFFLLMYIQEIDFVDGVAFTEDEMYITLGKVFQSWNRVGTVIKPDQFVDRIPNNGSPSSYRYMNIYYKSLQEKNTDYLTVLDYIWRWDTDWFWYACMCPLAVLLCSMVGCT